MRETDPPLPRCGADPVQQRFLTFEATPLVNQSIISPAVDWELEFRAAIILAGWQKGLTTRSEVWSGGVRKKWTTIDWTQDDTNPTTREFNTMISSPL